MSALLQKVRQVLPRFSQKSIRDQCAIWIFCMNLNLLVHVHVHVMFAAKKCVTQTNSFSNRIKRRRKISLSSIVSFLFKSSLFLIILQCSSSYSFTNPSHSLEPSTQSQADINNFNLLQNWDPVRYYIISFLTIIYWKLMYQYYPNYQEYFLVQKLQNWGNLCISVRRVRVYQVI